MLTLEIWLVAEILVAAFRIKAFVSLSRLTLFAFARSILFEMCRLTFRAVHTFLV